MKIHSTILELTHIGIIKLKKHFWNFVVNVSEEG